jgi:hypothetical protein
VNESLSFIKFTALIELFGLPMKYSFSYLAAHMRLVYDSGWYMDKKPATEACYEAL